MAKDRCKGGRKVGVPPALLKQPLGFWVRHVIPAANRVTKDFECGTRIPALIWIIGNEKSNLLNHRRCRFTRRESSIYYERSTHELWQGEFFYGKLRSPSVSNLYAIKYDTEASRTLKILEPSHLVLLSSFYWCAGPWDFVVNRVMLQWNVNMSSHTKCSRVTRNYGLSFDSESRSIYFYIW